MYIWRNADRPECVPPPKTPKVSVMIWGSICFHGVGTLCLMGGIINANKYIDILDNNLWPVVTRQFPFKNYLFQDDNAPVHRAHTVDAFKDNNNIPCVPWPAQSPDLNVIDNV